MKKKKRSSCFSVQSWIQVILWDTEILIKLTVEDDTLIQMRILGNIMFTSVLNYPLPHAKIPETYGAEWPLNII